MTKKKIPYSHIFPPHLYVGRDGLTYLIPMWQEVPADTILEDIEWVNPYTRTKELIAKVKSSKGDITYIIEKIGKEYTCTCPGHKYQNKLCKHIKALTI